MLQIEVNLTILNSIDSCLCNGFAWRQPHWNLKKILACAGVVVIFLSALEGLEARVPSLSFRIGAYPPRFKILAKFILQWSVRWLSVSSLDQGYDWLMIFAYQNETCYDFLKCI